ncbi:MAG: glycine betaine/L-proline ABC transporter ATP-binding protein [Dehalococcoidia bacterium]
MTTKIRVENLFKIFGTSPEASIEKLNKGASKDEIFRETGDIVGMADVSFTVDEGEIFMVMGLSGSGKSTLIRCINRLIEPTQGAVFIDDEDITNVSLERLRQIRRTKFSMVFQHFGLFPHRTVMENVEYGLKVRGVEREERRQKALEALNLVGLEGWGDRLPSALSGGMQQRVGLARGLATDPEILLMDEPFSALDPLIRRDMQGELIQLQRTVKKTILFITHDLNEALRLGDHIAVMKDGRIVQHGTPEEIVDQPVDEYVTAFIRDVDRGRVLTVSYSMREPQPLRYEHDTVQTAIKRMRELGRDGLYVVDQSNTPVGLVIDEAIASAARKGERNLGPVMITDFPQTNAETLVGDIYGISASGIPIAVVDEENHLVGVINQFDILAQVGADIQPENGEDKSAVVAGDASPDTLEGRLIQSAEVEEE